MNEELMAMFPDKPFIAWDWDSTLSSDGETVDEEVMKILELVKKKGFRQMIVSGRKPTEEPITCSMMPVISIHTIPEAIRKTEKFNGLRFKMWILRLSSKMLCYVDNDLDTVMALRRIGLMALTPHMLVQFLMDDNLHV